MLGRGARIARRPQSSVISAEAIKAKAERKATKQKHSDDSFFGLFVLFFAMALLAFT